MATVPAWLRRVIPDTQSLAGKDVEDVALTAGAAIGALDAVVRRQERWAGAWRQRLALTAAAATASRAGRSEDEGALRDAVLLTRPGDDVGPGGRMLLAWRRLALRPTDDLFTAAGLAAVLDEHGRAPDDGTTSELVDDLRRLAASGSFVTVLTGAFATAERHGLGHSFGSWLGDALLARKLGWSHAVPLLGVQPPGEGARGSRSQTRGLTQRGPDSGHRG
ncbi:DUF1403 family protein [Mesorhizobium japonicum]|uniref:DUF1403 family protein n=1 Tax=Mesorhizobium TaxID=68287 RepID=UPI002484BE0A|nr:DUF1403 family protein [Mesorhizobium japonicum]